MNKLERKRIDWLITLAPFISIMLLAGVLFVFPNESNNIISKVRFFFGDTVGIYYLVIGLAVLLVSVYLAFSKYGNVVLGEPNEKPKYPFFVWGSMMFTCGLAADILFYSFAEWVMYATNPHMEELGSVAEWAGVFPLFHWSFIPWAFYLVLAVVFGFMLHVRKRNRQRYSEACRPVIGKHADGVLGRVIDLFALFALLAGTATTFSVATPLLAAIIVKLFGITISRTVVTIIILLVTCAVYTYAVLHGFKGISFLAKLCIYLFFGLLLIVLLIGGQGKFIIENGFQSFGKMLQHFIELSTFTVRNAPVISHKIGQFIIGPIGWFGQSQLHSLLVIFHAAERLNKRFLEDMCLVLAQQLLVLSYLEIMGLGFKSVEKQILFPNMRKMETFMDSF